MRIAVALMTAASLSAFAMAQEAAPPFPVVNDLAEGWETNGAPAAIDVLGIKIGMPREAAQAAALAGVGVDASEGRLSESEVGVAGEYGIQVFFRYASGYTANKNTPTGGQDFLNMTFTTGVSGERVGIVERTLRWGAAELPRRPDIEASVKEKYGEPSWVDPANSEFMASYYYVYFKGEKVTYPEGTTSFGAPAPGTSDVCIRMIEGVGSYQFDDQPGQSHTPRAYQAERKDCSIILKVTINGSTTPGLVELAGGVDVGALARL
ncbi:MAG: hypothetical protein QM698_02240 [Micropepsaceae bacterium]